MTTIPTAHPILLQKSLDGNYDDDDHDLMMIREGERAKYHNNNHHIKKDS